MRPLNLHTCNTHCSVKPKFQLNLPSLLYNRQSYILLALVAVSHQRLFTALTNPFSTHNQLAHSCVHSPIRTRSASTSFSQSNTNYRPRPYPVNNVKPGSVFDIPGQCEPNIAPGTLHLSNVSQNHYPDKCSAVFVMFHFQSTARRYYQFIVHVAFTINSEKTVQNVYAVICSWLFMR